MRKIPYILLIAVILASCAGNKNQYTIRGTVNGVDTGIVFLQKFNADSWQKIDSVKLEKGKFTFQGKIELPEMWYLAIQDKQIFLPVFVESGKTEMEIYADSA
ncbi:MAG: DUF4369 domain-containing protein, partial [Bacteroidota bacterium]